MKYSGQDTKSRFRILKGGKISLIVSALLVGSFVTDAYAFGTSLQTVTNINEYNTTQVGNGLESPTSTIIIGLNGDLNVTGSPAIFVNVAEGTKTLNIDNAGTINSDDKTISIAVGEVPGPQELTFYIKNNADGTISSSGENAIYIDNSSTFTTIIDITNNGEITANSSTFADAIFLGGNDNNISIENNGKITTNGSSDSRGIHVATLKGDSQIINNTNGNITVSGVNRAEGIYIDAMNDASTITNRGTISAYIGDTLHKDAYSIRVDTSNITTNLIENTSTGKLYGNLQVVGTMSNAGLISLPHNAIYAYVHNFTNQSTGTLEIGLLTDGIHTTHSKLSTNNATFENGSTIKVNVLAASTDVALLKDTTLNDVVLATTSLTVNGTLNVTDNSALLDFEYVKDGLTIDLTAVEANDNSDGTGNIFNTSKLGNGNSNALKAASALDTIQAGNNPQMDQLFTQLNQLGTDAEVAAATESLTSQTTNASFGAATQISNNAARLVDQRQQANIDSGLNSGDAMFASQNIWLKTYGSIGKQNNKDGLNGFDINAYGLGMGVDGEYEENQKVGIALFYTRANLDVNNLDQSSDMDVYTTLVYGNVPMIDDKTNLLYQLGYAWQQTNSNRTLFTGQTAFADYTSKTASVDLKLLRDYTVNKSLLLQPMITTTYRHFDNPSYSETDAGANGLNVNSFTSSQFLLGLGTLAHYKLDKASKIIANVNVAYDTVGDNVSVTSAYQGAAGVTFDTAGIDNGRWQYEAGIGYEREVKEGHNLNLSYNYQGIGEGFSNNILSAKYVYSF